MANALRGWRCLELIIIIILNNIIIGCGFCDVQNYQGQGKCYQPNRRPRLITLTETLIILGCHKTESNNCFTKDCFEENNDKHTIARNLNGYYCY